MDELNMEPLPEDPKFREDLHYIEVVLDEDWSEAIPRVVCNDPDHGSTDCRMKDLIKDEGFSALRTPDSEHRPVIGKFQFGFEKEWSNGYRPGDAGWWEFSAIFRKNLPIEGEVNEGQDQE